MLSRALDEIIHATSRLPDHVTVASRAYDHDPRALAAFQTLLAALAAVDEAILGRQALPPRGVGETNGQPLWRRAPGGH